MKALQRLLVALLPLLSLPVISASEAGTSQTNASLPLALPKPAVFNAVEKHSVTTIGGLLITRQGCPSGFAECPNLPGLCGPIGGQCCSRSYYCYPGDWCYAGGCCHDNQNGCDGKGCCAKNWQCCKGGGCCNPGWECCGGGGCCWPGTYCAIQDDRKVCAPGSGGGGGGGESTTTITKISSRSTTIHQTTPRTLSNTVSASTTATTTPTTVHQTTFSNTVFTSTTATTTSTSTYTIVTTYTSLPPAPTGYQNDEIDLNDAELEWSVGWSVVTASCNATAKAKRCSSDNSYVNYSFQGTAVYLNFGSSNVNYAIFLDTEKVIEYNGFLSGSDAKPDNCTFSWAAEQLSGDETHLLVIKVYGSATPLHSARDISDYWLDLNNLVVQRATGSQTPSGTLTPGGIGSDDTSGASGNGATGFSAGYSLLVPFLFANLGIFLL